jgi:FKBP-type peptidyl-prolyl cis-trans isomerase FkpA
MPRDTFFRPSLLLLAGIGLLVACHDHSPPTSPVAHRALEIRELAPGTGESIGNGQSAAVDYMGWIFDPDAPEHKGRLFDSTSASGAPLKFQLGAGQVIKGWDQGILGMKVHGRRQLIIPPELAYGERGASALIPPGATLVFDVELVSIE